MLSGLSAALGTVLVLPVLTVLQLVVACFSWLWEILLIPSLIVSKVVFISDKISRCPEEVEFAGSGDEWCWAGWGQW